MKNLVTMAIYAQRQNSVNICSKAELWPVFEFNFFPKVFFYIYTGKSAQALGSISAALSTNRAYLSTTKDI